MLPSTTGVFTAPGLLRCLGSLRVDFGTEALPPASSSGAVRAESEATHQLLHRYNLQIQGQESLQFSADIPGRQLARKPAAGTCQYLARVFAPDFANPVL